MTRLGRLTQSLCLLLRRYYGCGGFFMGFFELLVLAFGLSFASQGTFLILIAVMSLAVQSTTAPVETPVPTPEAIVEFSSTEQQIAPTTSLGPIAFTEAHIMHPTTNKRTCFIICSYFNSFSYPKYRKRVILHQRYKIFGS